MSLIDFGLADLGAMVTDRFTLNDIEAACDLFRDPARRRPEGCDHPPDRCRRWYSRVVAGTVSSHCAQQTD